MSQEYEKYVELEQTAAQQKKGLHAPQQQWKIHRVIDLLGPANAQRANAYLQQLERIPRLDGIVEYVFGAARFKIRIPSVRKTKKRAEKDRDACATVPAASLTLCRHTCLLVVLCLEIDT